MTVIIIILSKNRLITLYWLYNADDNSYDNITSHTSVIMSYHTLNVSGSSESAYSVMLIVTYSKKSTGHNMSKDICPRTS